MTKIKPRFYAQALWELIHGEKVVARETVIVKILRLLQKNKQLKLWPQVIAAYEKLLRKKEGVILATVKTEREMSAAELAKITAFLQKTEQASTVELTIKKEALGLGVIIETTEKRWDLSLDKQITDFKKQLIS